MQVLHRIFVFAVAVMTVSAAITIRCQAQTTTGQTDGTTGKGTVSGRVINSVTGEAVARATIKLVKSMTGAANGNGGGYTGFGNGMGGGRGRFGGGGAAGSGGYMTTSTADGAFTFPGIDAGTYILSGEQPFYIETRYGAKTTTGRGKLITVTDGSTQNGLTLSLIPRGVIAGRVLDPDGSPVPQVMVQALRQSWMRGHLRFLPASGVNTNDLGEFRISSLQPGKYFIVAHPQNRDPGLTLLKDLSGKDNLRPVTTYYPGTQGIDSATPIVLTAGQQATGIDIQLRASQLYSVSGQITGNLDPNSRYFVILRERGAGRFGFNNNTMARKDGTFDLPPQPSGSYELIAMATGREGGGNVASQQVELGNGDLTNVALTLYPMVGVSGHVQVEGNTTVNVSTARISLLPVDEMSMGGRMENASIKEDGSFKLDAVPPGQYIVRAILQGDGLYLKSVRANQQEMRDTVLDLSQGGSPTLTVTFSTGAGQISGSIDSQDPNTVSGVSVILVPVQAPPDGTGVKTVVSDTSGQFTFKNLTPGDYRIFAQADADLQIWQNPDFVKAMNQNATEVQVAENGTAQVKVPLTGDDQIEKVTQQAGL